MISNEILAGIYCSSKYEEMCNAYSDINEHLPTLSKYASECKSIIEFGVRDSIASWAFINGLLESDETNKKFFLNISSKCDIEEFLYKTQYSDIKINYEWINNLKLIITESYDLTFIDTWHIYGQLARELDKFSKITNKYIIMHDTTIDEWEGESVRLGNNINQRSKDSGFSIEEIAKGLWPAITDFLSTNLDWELHERFTNNNGLTILKKKID